MYLEEPDQKAHTKNILQNKFKCTECFQDKTHCNGIVWHIFNCKQIKFQSSVRLRTKSTREAVSFFGPLFLLFM